MSKATTAICIACLVASASFAFWPASYKITQEYRADWKSDRFYVYKCIGWKPICFYALTMPSYSTLSDAEKSVALQIAGAERTVKEVP